MDPSHMLAPGYSHPLSRKWQSDHTEWNATHLIYPIFVHDDKGKKQEIVSMPGQVQCSVDRLQELVDPLIKLGLTSVILFAVIENDEKKSLDAAYAYSPDNPVIRAVQLLKSSYPNLYVICDVCMCQYTTSGHCGVLYEDADGVEIDQNKSIPLIAKIALAYATAGADMVAPSDMMCGRIAAITEIFRGTRYERKVPVLSYSAKFASCSYGPFRGAANSKPMQGDRKGYQLPTGAAGLASSALKRDVAEGARFLMVKPATRFLDIVKSAKTDYPEIPICVYHVSGEFSAIHAAVEKGVYKLRDIVEETIVSFRRAGATMIITYFVPELLQWLSDDKSVMEI